MQGNESLRQQRIRRNWRQQDVADQLGTTITTIGRWERGAQQPGAYFRVKLYARNPHFTGRDDVLQQLGQLLAAKPPGELMSFQQAALTQTQAISGLARRKSPSNMPIGRGCKEAIAIPSGLLRPTKRRS